VNSNGLVVGSSANSSGFQVPVSWANPTSPQNRLPTSYATGTFYGVNSAGIAVGEAQDLTNTVQPIWWDGGSNPALLLPLPSGADSGVAHSVNDHDQVQAVGWCFFGAEGQQPVIWTKTGTTTWTAAKLSNNGNHLGKANFVTNDTEAVGNGLSPIEMLTYASTGPPVYVRDCNDDTVAVWAQKYNSAFYCVGNSARPFEWKGNPGTASGFFKDLNNLLLPGETKSILSVSSFTRGLEFVYLVKASDNAVYLAKSVGSYSPFNPLSYTVTSGTYQAGGTTELTSYDGTFLDVKRPTLSADSYPIHVEFTFKVNNLSPSELLVRLIQSVDLPGIYEMKVDVYDWSASNWSTSMAQTILFKSCGKAARLKSTSPRDFIKQESTVGGYDESTVRVRIRMRGYLVSSPSALYRSLTDQVAVYTKS